MKIKTSKILAVLCILAMMVATIVPMLTLSATAAEKSATLTFDTTSKRTEQTSSKQVWTENGIVLTNDKASSSSAIGNYAKPARFYASSSITVTAPGNITKIVFDCSSSSYATAMKNSIGSGATASSDKVTVTLNGSSDTYTVAKLTAQVRMDSITVTYAESSCAHTNTEVLEGYDATCTSDGLTEGLKCLDCGLTINVQSVIPGGHKYVDSVCTVCGEEILDYSGRYYIATKRSSGNYWYMTNDLGSATTKRYTAIDTGLTVLPEKITSPESKYVFVLENNGDGTYYIYAEGTATNNYLGWSSGNSGNLVQKTSAKKLTVDQLESGLFNIHFSATDGERYVSLNSTTGSNYFAFYAGTQSQNLALIPVVEAPAGEISNVAVSLGTDLSLLYQIEIADGESFDNFSMVFELNGKTVTLGETSDGIYKLGGIAPHMMGDTVTATLYKGDEVVDVYTTTIKDYLTTVINGNYADDVKELAKDLLIYGAAAQKHQDYKTDALVTSEAVAAKGDIPGSDLVLSQESAAIDGLTFAKVGVHFNYVNKLFIKVTNTANANITVTVNGEEAVIGEDGCVYTEAIAPNEFTEIYVFELYVDGELYQNVEYSVNSYIYAKWDDASGLAKALYNYAISFANLK